MEDALALGGDGEDLASLYVLRAALCEGACDQDADGLGSDRGKDDAEDSESENEARDCVLGGGGLGLHDGDACAFVEVPPMLLAENDPNVFNQCLLLRPRSGTKQWPRRACRQSGLFQASNASAQGFNSGAPSARPRVKATCGFTAVNNASVAPPASWRATLGGC